MEPQMQPDMGAGVADEQSIQAQLDALDQADQIEGAGIDPSLISEQSMQSENPMDAHLAHIEEQLAALEEADRMEELSKGPGIQAIIEQSNQSMQETMGGYTQMVSESITQSLGEVGQGISANNAAITDAISAMASKVDEAIMLASMKDSSEKETSGVTPAQFTTLVKEMKSSIDGLAKKLTAQPIDLGPITDGIKSLKSEESKPEKIDLSPLISEIKKSLDSLPSKMPKPESPDMGVVVDGLKKVQEAIGNIRIPIPKGSSGGQLTGQINMKLGGSDAQWKDDTFYGDDVISGIGSVALRVWDGAGYDRVPGNAVSGVSINISQSPFQKLIDEAGAPATTYVGQSAAGTAQGTSAWTVERITVSGTTTTIQHGFGTWTGRAGLSYS
jgi:hypothetical protein